MFSKVLLLGFLWLHTAFAGHLCTDERCQATNDSLNFFLLADWGGMRYWPYYTYAQKFVAATLAEMAPRLGTDFVLAVGDNFYYYGVTDVEDTRFNVSQPFRSMQSALCPSQFRVTTSLWHHLLSLTCGVRCICVCILYSILLYFC